jgi:CubicO group peptidase (beta-lactamase class C family)
MAFRAQLQDLLDAALRAHDIPGAVVAVDRGGETTVAAGGVLNRNTGVTVTPDSLFQVGSTTKVWTAALVLQLVDEGLVELDAPVRRYLPEFAVRDAAATETVTVRQLLSHTGGFVGDLFEDTGSNEDALERYLGLLGTAAGQVHPPGALFSYSNSGFCVLGALVAALRGTSWERALRERLAEPLGVRQIALGAGEAILFRTAVGHIAAPGADTATVFPRWELPRSNAPAGASLCLSPAELLRFGRMLIADGVTADGTRLLAADTVAAMGTPQVELPGVNRRGPRRWGLGLMLFDWGSSQVYGHDGGTIGQDTTWRVLPEHDLVVAAVSNGGPHDPLVSEVLAPVLRELAGVDIPARPSVPEHPVPFDPAPFVGTYAVTEETWTVTAAGDRLHATLTPSARMAAMGASTEEIDLVALADSTFIEVEPAGGLHRTLAFTQGYLHAFRAIPRVGD